MGLAAHGQLFSAFWQVFAFLQWSPYVQKEASYVGLWDKALLICEYKDKYLNAARIRSVAVVGSSLSSTTSPVTSRWFSKWYQAWIHSYWAAPKLS